MALSVHIKKKLKDFELAVDFDMDEGIVGFLGSSVLFYTISRRKERYFSQVFRIFLKQPSPGPAGRSKFPKGR